MLNMSLGGDKVARFFSIHSSAPSIVKDLARKLISENRPTAMLGLPMTTQEIINHNQNVSMLVHQMCCIGYNVRADSEK